MDEFKVIEEYEARNLDWQINNMFQNGYELWKFMHIQAYAGFQERFLMIFRKIAKAEAQ